MKRRWIFNSLIHKFIFLVVMISFVNFVGSLKFIGNLRDVHIVRGNPIWWTCVVEKDSFKQYIFYEWKFEDELIDSNTSGIVNYGNGTIYIQQVTSSNIGRYTCRASNGQMSIETSASLHFSFANSSEVTVESSIASTSAADVKLGSDVTIFCKFDASPKVTFRWFLNEAELHETMTDGVKITDHERNSTLLITNIGYPMAGDYKCQVDHETLDSPLNSSSVQINVYGKPVLSRQMISQATADRYNATLRCPLEGGSNVSVEWRFMSSSINAISQESSPIIKLVPSPAENSFVNLQSSIISLSDNGVTLNVINANNVSAGIYSCLWSNEHGSVVSNTTLFVSNSPQLPKIIESQPINRTIVSEGSALNINCIGTGIPTPMVEWTFPNGKQIMQYPSSSNVNQEGVVTVTSTLFIPNLYRNQSGQYQCKMVNSLGNSSSSITNVDVIYKPYSSLQNETNIIVDEGKSVEIKCDIFGHPNPSISWILPWRSVQLNSSVGENSDVFLQNNNSLIINRVQKFHQGVYICSGSNEVGTIQNHAYVTVRGPPKIVRPPVSFGSVENEKVKLTCEIDGYPLPVITWHFLSLPDPSVKAIDMPKVMQYALYDMGNWTGEPIVDLSVNPKSGIVTKSGKLEVLNAKSNDGGLYVCKAENQYGIKKTAAVVRVVTPPEFEIKPVDREISPGDNVVLNCHSNGIPVPTQRWLYNNRRIDFFENERFTSFSNGSLSISPITIDDLGTYTCLSTNEFGQRSVSATVALSSKPYFVHEPKNSSFAEFQTGVLDCMGKSDIGFMTSWYKKTSAENEDNIFIGSVLIAKAASLPNSVESTGASHSRIHIKANDSLVISCVQKSDESLYFCRLQNDDGFVESGVISLQVKSTPGTINIELPLSAIAGTSVEIVCEVVYLQNATISWISPKLTLITEKDYLTYPGIASVETSIDGKKSTLFIDGLSNKDHGGVWGCKVCSAVGCAMRSSTMTIEDKPIITEIQMVSFEDSISVRCVPLGIPSAKVEYFINGEQITSDTKGHRAIEGSIIIENEKLGGEYSCSASNSLGSYSVPFSKPQEMTAIKAIPYVNSIVVEAIAELPLVSITPSHVTVEYKIMNNNSNYIDNWESVYYNISSDIQSYIDVFEFIRLEDNKRACSSSSTDSDLINNKQQNNLELSITSNNQFFRYTFELILQPLIPYTHYIIRVALVNKMGQSSFSTTSNILTLPSAPPPVDSISIGVLHRETWISWKNPTHFNGNPKNIIVIVTVYKIISDNGNYSMYLQKNISPLNEPVVSFELMEIANYVVEISLFNNEINANSEVISSEFTVKDETPNFVPEIKQLKSIHHDQVVITWTTPSNSSQLIIPVTGYSVIIYPKTANNNHNTTILNITGINSSTITVNELEERVTYTVRIASRNSVGLGSYSTPQDFTTAYAPFSTIPLGTADAVDGSRWRMIAIILVVVLIAIGIVVVAVAIAIQVRMKRKGHVEITTQSSESGSFHEEPMAATSEIEGATNYNFMMY